MVSNCSTLAQGNFTTPQNTVESLWKAFDDINPDLFLKCFSQNLATTVIGTAKGMMFVRKDGDFDKKVMSTYGFAI